MEINIRKHVLSNLDDSSYDQIEATIVESISEGDEITLPGLGVLFEILWSNATDEQKSVIVTVISNAISHKG